MSIDTVHTDKQRVEKLELLIAHCKHLGETLKDLEVPNGPGDVRGLLKLLRFNGETLIEFAKEGEGCLKALIIADSNLRRKTLKAQTSEVWGYDG